MDTEDIELSDIEDSGSEDSDNKPTPPDRDFLYLDEIDREHAETIRSFLQNHPSEQDRLLSQFAKIYKKKIVPENRPTLKNFKMDDFESYFEDYVNQLNSATSLSHVDRTINRFKSVIENDFRKDELPIDATDRIDRAAASRKLEIENATGMAMVQNYTDTAKNIADVFTLDEYTKGYLGKLDTGSYENPHVVESVKNNIINAHKAFAENLIKLKTRTLQPMSASATSTSTSAPRAVKRERVDTDPFPASEPKPAILHTSVAIKREGRSNLSPIASNMYLSDGKTMKKSYEKFINSPALNRTTKKRQQRFRSETTEQIMRDVKAAFSTKHGLGKDGVKNALQSWKALRSGLSTTVQEAARKWSNWVAADQKRIDFFGNPNSMRKESHLPYIPYVGGINRGSIAPYYVEMGVIRGGGHRKGIQVTNPKLGGSGRGFAIPMVDSTDRKLISLQAKYRNPALYPRDRIIKFIAGRFGTDYPTTRTAGTIPTVTSRPF